VVILAAVVLGIPAQPLWVFGVLMVTLGLLAAAVFAVLDRRAERENDGTALSRTLSAVTPSASTSGSGAATNGRHCVGWEHRPGRPAK
jgi:hypothetical protein